MKNKSKREISGAPKLIFCLKDLARSYRPPMGLAAAKIDVRAFNVAFIPAYTTQERFRTIFKFTESWLMTKYLFIFCTLVIEIVCCSMVS